MSYNWCQCPVVSISVYISDQGGGGGGGGGDGVHLTLNHLWWPPTQQQVKQETCCHDNCSSSVKNIVVVELRDKLEGSEDEIKLYSQDARLLLRNFDDSFSNLRINKINYQGNSSITKLLTTVPASSSSCWQTASKGNLILGCGDVPHHAQLFNSARLILMMTENWYHYVASFIGCAVSYKLNIMLLLRWRN